MTKPAQILTTVSVLARAVAFVGALALTPGCGVSGSDAKAGAGEGKRPAAARVRVAPVRQGVLRDRLVFLGEARPLLQAELGAAADAEIMVVTVRVGDRVKRGEVLVRLDPALARARVASAKASRAETFEALRQARRDTSRTAKLTDVLPDAEIERDASRAEQLDARASALKAAEREAKARLSRYEVVAPFDGVVRARNVDPGDWVAPGDTVLEIVDDESVEIIVAGSAELVQSVGLQTPATVKLGTDTVPATVVGIVRALDPTTRTARLRLEPEHTPPWLLPGASIDVEFEIERDDEGVLVPRDALVYGAAGNRVVVARDGVAQMVPVEIVASANTEALVRGAGLQAGDSVVIRGNERLRPGQELAVESEPAKAD